MPIDYRKILTENGAENVSPGMIKAIQKAVGGSYVPRERYNKQLEAAKSAQEALSARGTETDEPPVSANAQQIDALTAKLERANAALRAAKEKSRAAIIEKRKTQREARTLNARTAERENADKLAAVQKQLIADGANEKFAKVVAAAFDLTKVTLDGDGVKDWETISKPHKEEFADVFKTASGKGVETANPPVKETEGDPFLAGFNKSSLK